MRRRLRRPGAGAAGRRSAGLLANLAAGYRLIHRPRCDRKSFSWREHRDLPTAAHQQLGGPIVLVWDNLRVHEAAKLRRRPAARDWLTIY
ncbi:hypothetical protein [Streptomyces palmae]|uniref:hypothetical protein n=1 Tax=Streptomyces palmae TaxID=1701085 RepID=UPI0035F0F9FE